MSIYTGGLNDLAAMLTQLVQNRGVPLPERATEIDANRDQREQYSRENAFADAEGLMQQQLAASLQESGSAMTRAMEGAGASGSSLRALLVSQQAKEAAQAAAALGAQQAVSYGGIANDASQLLELLTRPDDAALQALVQTMGIKQEALNTKNRKTPSPSRFDGTRVPASAAKGSSTRREGLRPAPAKPSHTVNASYQPWPTTSLPEGGLSPKFTPLVIPALKGPYEERLEYLTEAAKPRLR
jgi:hypothetical protein